MQISNKRSGLWRWIAALFLAASLPAAHAQTLYTTGFENPPFRTGNLTGQDGWGNEGVAGSATIQASLAQSGTQSVRLDSNQTPDAISFFYKPINYAATGGEIVEVTWRMRIQSASAPSLQYGVDCFDSNLNYIGGLSVDALTRFVIVSDGAIQRETTQTVAKDVWNTFRLRFDYGTRTLSAYVNEVLVASGHLFGANANAVFGEVDLFADNRSDPRGNDVAYMDTLQVAVVTPTNRVSGVVALTGMENPQGESLTFDFRPTNGGATLSRNVTLGAGGAFEVADLPRQSYHLAAVGRKWLRQVIANIDASANPVSGLNFTLIPGDLNGDNIIDLFDLVSLFDAYGASSNAPMGPADPNWNERADLNGDAFVDLFDLVLLFDGYGLSGDD